MARRKKVRRGGKRDIVLWGLWGIAALGLFALWLLHDLPNLDEAKPLDAKPSVAVLANDGTLIARYGGLMGDTVQKKDVSPLLIHAVIATEDRRFYTHGGIDPWGLARAMLRNVFAGRWAQGGSTITQQLAKNLFLTPEKTLRRKAQEAIMAVRIEHRFKKDDILMAYLNRAYFGAGAYGVDAAARTYFNKPPARLSLLESAMLAGLLKAPSRLSPLANPDKALARAKVVIGAMEEEGYIKKSTAEHEIKTATSPRMPGLAGDLNKYFVDWVIAQADSLITEGAGDLVIKTTLDPKLQLMAEARLTAVMKKIPAEDKVSQAALVTESTDGAVLAMIGGVDYSKSQFNRATQALRQPGSAFKPLVYLAALEDGMEPEDTVEDSPITSGEYRPENYGRKYFGEVTLSEALARSLNTATIRVLQKTGIDRFMSVAQRLGFTHMPAPELSAGLGANEVTPLELANAYAVIAAGGMAVWPHAILSIKDGAGNILYQREEPEAARVFNKDNIRDLGRMLEGVLGDEGTGKAARLANAPAAGKTGTTQNYRDAWFVGYSGALATAVWVGNDDGAPMREVTGGKYPAQIWRDYMNDAVHFTIPVFVPEATPVGADFSSVLDRWTSDETPPRPATAVYNN